MAVVGTHTAIVGQAVRHHQKGRFHYKVVSGNLIEDLLCDFDMGRFVFDNQNRFKSLTPEQNCVAAAGSVVERQGDFICYQAGRIAEMIDQIGREMLPYPFFGSKGYEAVAQRIENPDNTVGRALYPRLNRRERKGGKQGLPGGGHIARGNSAECPEESVEDIRNGFFGIRTFLDVIVEFLVADLREVDIELGRLAVRQTRVVEHLFKI